MKQKEGVVEEIAEGSTRGKASEHERCEKMRASSESSSSESDGEGADVGSTGVGMPVRTRAGRGRASRGRARASRGRAGKKRPGTGGNVSKQRTGRGSANNNAEGDDEEKANEGYYEVSDEENDLLSFTPTREPGIHFDRPLLRGNLANELDFFHLFLTPEMISSIVTNTNAYALQKVIDRDAGYCRAYVDKDGFWSETSCEELERLIALLIYFGMVKVDSKIENYWSTKSIYHGLWARKIMSRDRYKSLMAFLHVSDPESETPGQKLRKVEAFLAVFKERCKLLYQPSQNLAVDERMVKSKHRSGIRQYMKDKPTKWGVKLWVLADSNNGFTVDFNVYIGKEAAKATSKNGLGYDVVMELMQPYLNQGYNLYLDNFYTSPELLSSLFMSGTSATGTVKLNRSGIPKCLLNVHEWARKHERGDVRWIRHSPVLALQWVDSKPVTILTTLFSANEETTCERRVKRDGKFERVEVTQPLAVHYYNQHMNGVDRSDQMLSNHNVRQKCYRWWKVLFFHLIDIAIVNSFLLFQQYRAQNPEVEALHRMKSYSIANFREALVRQICNWSEYDNPPAYVRKTPGPGQFETVHMPQVSEYKRNCTVCYKEGRGELKVVTYCAAPQCQKYLHITSNRNCFETWHSKDYKR